MTLITGIFLFLLQWTNPMAPPPPPNGGSEMNALYSTDEFSVSPYSAVDCDELYELSKMKCKGDKDCMEERWQAKKDYQEYCKHNVTLPLILELFLFLSFILMSYIFFYKKHVFATLKRAFQ